LANLICHLFLSLSQQGCFGGDDTLRAFGRARGGVVRDDGLPLGSLRTVRCLFLCATRPRWNDLSKPHTFPFDFALVRHIFVDAGHRHAVRSLTSQEWVRVSGERKQRRRAAPSHVIARLSSGKARVRDGETAGGAPSAAALGVQLLRHARPRRGRGPVQS
jgi:hypothetical protein